MLFTAVWLLCLSFFVNLWMAKEISAVGSFEELGLFACNGSFVGMGLSVTYEGKNIYSIKDGIEWDNLRRLNPPVILFLTSSNILHSNIDQLVKQWAPLIWMSPEEKYMPLSVEEFLSHVYIGDENGKKVESSHSRMFSRYNAKTFYLVTHRKLEELKNDNTSFLYGKNPKLHSIPVYAAVTHCSSYKSFHTSDKANLRRDINAIYRKNANKFYFHVSYWLFYPYNEGKEVCFLVMILNLLAFGVEIDIDKVLSNTKCQKVCNVRTGRVPAPRIFNTCFGKIKTLGNHLGDWEHMSLSFSGSTFPDKLYLAVHDAGVYYQYDVNRRYFKYESKITRKGVAQVPKFPEIVRAQNGHPVLFAAYGSHGLWAAPGEHDFIRVRNSLEDVEQYKNISFGKNYFAVMDEFQGKMGKPKKAIAYFLRS
ncbi:hypothetical protein NQ315_002443 [Exocentrus adspersus]|uniref:Uncharacterized protein n=1 Tax=Exocentrus adspersus TaxID=1586481 RepID=A0AAV8VHS2_9CUCU|nr:hypothetical protein NQ315_002443 [Exocentrus adspersus]